MSEFWHVVTLPDKNGYSRKVRTFSTSSMLVDNHFLHLHWESIRPSGCFHGFINLVSKLVFTCRSRRPKWSGFIVKLTYYPLTVKETKSRSSCIQTLRGERRTSIFWCTTFKRNSNQEELVRRSLVTDRRVFKLVWSWRWPTISLLFRGTS